MSNDSCNSGRLSWLMKSCFPNTQDHHHHLRRISAVEKPPENSPISSLPDDLLLECLCRVSLSSLPSLPLVSRLWSRLVSSHSFLVLRRLRLPFRPTVFSLVGDAHFATLRLGIDSHWSITSFSFPPESDATRHHTLVTAVGPHVYIIGRASVFRLDTWTKSVTVRSQMKYSRKKFAAAVVGGRIYVAGGTARASPVEEYDPDSDTWRVVSDAPRRRYGCIGTSADGVFYVIGGLRIGGEDGTEAHHVYASSMDLYKVGSGTWLRSRVVPGGGCVVAACSVEGHVFVLASHTVELSFWRFDGRRKRGGSFGEWRKLKSPPLRAQARLDNTVRFSCAGVGNMIVVIQVMGCLEDHMMRRSRREGRTNGNGSTTKEVSVMVYNCDCEEWTRGPSMPDVTPRATCVCMEC